MKQKFKKTILEIISIIGFIFLLALVVTSWYFNSKIDTLHEAVQINYKLKNYSLAESQSDKLIDFALTKKKFWFISFKGDWNFGNAVHTAHTVKGLAHFERAEIASAKEELMFSAQINGSPQLDSYGPSMLLALELLKINERDIVIKYLESCRKFYDYENKLSDLIYQINNGSIPTFNSRQLELY